MDSRKITIISTNRQKTSTIMSSATTLRELKEDLRQNNIDYGDMVFYEGISKTELRIDDAILPQNLPYKGKITNELVFMLTTADKKIKSGAFSLNRTVVYADIKGYNLQEEVMKKLGKHYTRCKTEDLARIVTDFEYDIINKRLELERKEQSSKHASNQDSNEKVEDVVKSVLYKLVEILSAKTYWDGEPIISSAVSRILFGILEGTNQLSELDEKSSYSEEDIDDMFKDML